MVSVELYSGTDSFPTQPAVVPMDTNLLATKLLIPPSSHHTVRRERLIDALEHEMPIARLVLVSAPSPDRWSGC